MSKKSQAKIRLKNKTQKISGLIVDTVVDTAIWSILEIPMVLGGGRGWKQPTQGFQIQKLPNRAYDAQTIKIKDWVKDLRALKVWNSTYFGFICPRCWLVLLLPPRLVVLSLFFFGI